MVLNMLWRADSATAGFHTRSQIVMRSCTLQFLAAEPNSRPGPDDLLDVLAIHLAVTKFLPRFRSSRFSDLAFAPWTSGDSAQPLKLVPARRAIMSPDGDAAPPLNRMPPQRYPLCLGSCLLDSLLWTTVSRRIATDYGRARH